MSKRIWTVVAILGTALQAATSSATARNRDVTVEIINTNGSTFEQFPVSQGGSAFRAYLEAERNAPYRIRIHNCTGQRVAVVVAVDGRNIISGAKSDLERTEPMYILGPYESQDYSGWRTSLTDVHEFFFTEWQNSYADAFGDRSARGVIAVAAYREKQRYLPQLNMSPSAKEERPERGAAQHRLPHRRMPARPASSPAPMRRRRMPSRAPASASSAMSPSRESNSSPSHGRARVSS